MSEAYKIVYRDGTVSPEAIDRATAYNVLSLWRRNESWFKEYHGPAYLLRIRLKGVQ